MEGRSKRVAFSRSRDKVSRPEKEERKRLRAFLS